MAREHPVQFESELDLPALLVQCAQEEGIPVAGAVDLDLAYLPSADSSRSILPHIERYDQWLQAGYSGAMEYLVRGRDRRADPRLVFPQAESILCVALPYAKRPAGSTNFSKGVRYARYLQGGDYHLQLAERLQRIMVKTNQIWTEKLKQPELKWKICVDTSAVLERSWASLAGIGWIGKNSLLIHPKYGSYLFLGEVLLNQKTGRAPSPLRNYCGNCTRCLQGCPTGALEKPGVLNSNRCISYWTLEKRGELPISADQKSKIGNWVAGCDLCQEVCPFNQKPVKMELASGDAASALYATGPQNATLVHEWIALLNETLEDYRKRVKVSALSRVKPAQFSRNLAIALKNSWENLPFEDQQKLGPILAPLTRFRLTQETDPIAQADWAACALALERTHVQSPNLTP